MKKATPATTPLGRALDALCQQAGESRRSLSIKAGLSESAIKHIINKSSNSPRVETLIRLTRAVPVSCHIFLGNHGLKADLMLGDDEGKSDLGIALADTAAQITQTAEEAEWLGTWRDMNDTQRRRAVALLHALIDSDAA